MRFRLGLGDSGSGAWPLYPPMRPASEPLSPTSQGEVRPQGDLRESASGLLIPPGPSGDQLGQIVLSRLSSGQIDRGKDIFQPDLLGIKTDGKKVLPGVIGYCRDTRRAVMAAHTASGQPLHTNPPCCTRPATRKFTHSAVHEESSVWPGHPAFSHHPARLVLLWDNSVYLIFPSAPITTGRFPLGGPMPRRPSVGPSLLNGRK